MSEGGVKIRLKVEMTGGSMGDLLSRMGAQAKQFFGDEPYRLVGTVDVESQEEIGTVSGKTVAMVWSGTATYVNTD